MYQAKNAHDMMPTDYFLIYVRHSFCQLNDKIFIFALTI